MAVMQSLVMWNLPAPLYGIGAVPVGGQHPRLVTPSFEYCKADCYCVNSFHGPDALFSGLTPPIGDAELAASETRLPSAHMCKVFSLHAPPLFGYSNVVI
jgi:hypothetical protein